MQALESEERNLLRLHLMEGMSFDALATAFQSSRATMFGRLRAVRQRVLEKVQDLLRKQLGIGAEELEALAKDVRSNLDLSLSRILRD